MRDYTLRSFDNVPHTITPAIIESGVAFIQRVLPDDPSFTVKPKPPGNSILVYSAVYSRSFDRGDVSEGVEGRYSSSRVRAGSERIDGEERVRETAETALRDNQMIRNETHSVVQQYEYR